MRCPHCTDSGLRHSVFVHSSSTTLLGWSGYYDEDDKYHSHNPNRTNKKYSCSNGHTILKSRLEPCPSCEYGKKEEESLMVLDDTGGRNYHAIMRRFLTGGAVITVLAVISLFVIQQGYATLVDEPDPVGLVPANIQNTLRFIDGVEGHGILFPENRGMTVAIGPPEDCWEQMSLSNVIHETRVNIWLPNDGPVCPPPGIIDRDYSTDDATDSDEECQDYADGECARAGFGTGQGNASVSDPDENGCLTCMDECTEGCNNNGECPYAGITQCPE